MANRGARTADEYFALGCAIDASGGGRADVSADAYEQAARMGHTHAEFNLGVIRASGQGRPVDLAQARVHYATAAARGYANAQYNLGVMLQNGEGGAIDEAGAERLYRRAAATGFSRACFNLGLMLVNGLPPERQNWAEAMHWFERAAAGGCVDSLVCMGEHLSAQGAHARAVACYERAAARGHSRAEFHLGGLCEAGGQPARAVAHYASAAARGYLPAIASLGICYATGAGVDADPARAEALFEQVLACEDACEFETFQMHAHLGALREATDAYRASAHYWHAAANGVDWAGDRLAELVARAGWDARALIDHLLAAARSPSAGVRAVAVRVLAAVRERCSGCGAADRRLKRCAGCRVARFCDRACTHRAWHAHKVTCGPCE